MVNFVKIIFSLNLWFINPLLTILMINSITICLSYDYIGLFDFTAYNRFAKVKKFYLGDFSGVPSLIINLLWAGFFVKSIDLSDVYVYLPLKVWKKLWILNIFTHLFIGYLINLI
jgi:ABC-type phosphate transport system permease subunit